MITCLFAVFIILQILDVYTTYVALNNGGTEENRFLRKLMEKYSVLPTLLTTKSLGTLLLFAIVFVIPVVPQHAMIGLSILIIFYTGILVNNVIQLRRMRNG